MKKKFTFVIAMLLVVALAMPSSAAVFTDVSTDHWAYEAVNKLVAAGIIEGYPDGTFKGDKSVTRYEVAMMVDRVLERVAEERASLEDEVDAMKDGFTSAQKTELEDIVKSIVEKNMPEPKEETSEDTEGLNEKEYEQIANLIEALTFNYKAELKNLGSDLEDLEGLVDANKEETDATIAELKAEMNEKMNKVTFDGSYAVDFYDVEVDGSGYEDPYSYETDDPAVYDEADENFEQSLGLNVEVNKGPLSADLDLKATSNGFGFANEDGFALDTLSGTITAPTFDATIAEEQEKGLREYLFDGVYDSDDEWDGPVVNGVVVETQSGSYIMHGEEIDPDEDVEDDEYPIYTMAANDSITLMNQPINMVFGYEDEYGEESGTRIIGGYTTFNMAPLSVTPEFAMNDETDKRYFNLDATADMDLAKVVFNYKNIENFEEIQAGDVDDKGMSVKATRSIGMVDLAAEYAKYEETNANEPEMDLTAEILEENAMNLAGFNMYGDVQYHNFLDVSNASRFAWNATAKRSISAVDLTGMLEYAKDDTEYANTENLDDADNDYSNDDYFDKTLKAETTMADITAKAEYVFDKDQELTTHLYTADYEKGMLSAGLTQDMIAEETTITASVDPEAYMVMDVSLNPYFNYKRELSAELQDVVVGFDAEKALNKYATLTGGYEYADKAIDPEEDDYTFLPGVLKTTELGVKYDVSSDVEATANMTNLDFDGDNPAEDYTVNELTAGVSVSF